MMASFDGLQPEFRRRLEALFAEAGSRLRLNYGFRTRAEQQHLYDLWLAGEGAPANRPGTSMHEKGWAADVDDLGKYAALRIQLARKYGFYQPYPTREPWHLELDPKRGPLPAGTKEQASMLVIEAQGTAQIDERSGWAFGRHGHVYQYGGAGYFGGWDDVTRNGDRLCVALVPTVSGKGYWLVSNHGEVYAYGDASFTGNYDIKWGSGVIIGAWRNRLLSNGGVTLLRDDGSHLNTYALPA